MTLIPRDANGYQYQQEVVTGKTGTLAVETDAVRIMGSTGEATSKEAILDQGSHSLVEISFSHHKIHKGEHFFSTVSDTDVDTLAPKYIRITTPNTTAWAHLLLRYTSTGAGLWEFFENPTLTGAGTAVTIFNNRNSAGTPSVTAFQDTTVSADGTLLWSDRTGTNGVGLTRNSGSSGREDELMLKQNEDYILKFTPDADNTGIVVGASFYEQVYQEV